VIKTGSLVLLVQGSVVAVAGFVLSLWLPQLMNTPPKLAGSFQQLIALQCLITGFSLAVRMPGQMLAAYQRYDLGNLIQVGQMAVSLGALWLGFSAHMGLYSMVLAGACGVLFTSTLAVGAVLRLRLFPAKAHSGRVTRKVFKELMVFGGDIFVFAVGWQLVSASQVIIVSRTLGLEAAAVWAIATKAFTMAQQFIWRLYDFSGAALSEMVVRGEYSRLHRRLKDLVVVTTSASLLVGAACAICNQPFLLFWTKGRVSWSLSSDILMGLLVLVLSVTRCFTGLGGIAKQMHRVRFLCFYEGVAFVGLAVAFARFWGLPGIIAASILADVLCSGIFGWRMVRTYFADKAEANAWDWFAPSVRYSLFLVPTAAAIFWATRSLSPLAALVLKGTSISIIGGVLLVKFGLTEDAQGEVLKAWRKLEGRILPSRNFKAP
jgi:O-antigen/teichoic acid export membrane protein